MSAKVSAVLETVYASLRNDNEGIDVLIDQLREALAAEDMKEVAVDPQRLPHPNRQGRKMMQAYFKKRGVAVVFKE
jgi:hypothetical protein